MYAGTNLYSRHLSNWKNVDTYSFYETDCNSFSSNDKYRCGSCRNSESPEVYPHLSYDPLKYQTSSNDVHTSCTNFSSLTSLYSSDLYEYTSSLSKKKSDYHLHEKSENPSSFFKSSILPAYGSSYHMHDTDKSTNFLASRSDTFNGGFTYDQETSGLLRRSSSKSSLDFDLEEGRKLPDPNNNSATEKIILLKDESKIRGAGTTGIANIGNTCFMNSIIQCLSHIVKLRDYSIQSEYNRQLNKKSPLQGKLVKAFSELIKQLWSGTTSHVVPSSFKMQIQKFSARFAGRHQHDSQEFLRFLLEGLHQEINQVTKKPTPLPNLSHLRPNERAKATWSWFETKDKSFIFDLFVGQLQSSLECLECGHVSLTFDPFWDLSLPIPKASIYSLENTISLYECLENFTKEEVLEKDEMPTCENCKVKRKMKKKLLIHRFPEILVIHLKRFREGNHYKQKQTRSVSFPVRGALSLAHFSTDICEDKHSANYQLFAVSNHSGSCLGGHYTAYCKNQDLSQWHEFDDSRVTKISESRVCSKQAYVLFYVRKTVQKI